MESPITFDCEGSRLIGLLNVPEPAPTRGVVFVVADGPQYRAGVQRQFVKLCRAMEGAGLAALRFDYRGMGDSEGEHRGYECVDEDIRAAIDALLERVPSVRDVVLWGECDSTAAVLMYAYTDPRVSAISIANPWVRTEEGRARTRVKHYYKDRLLDPKLWKKVASGQFDLKGSVTSLARNVRLSLAKGGSDKAGGADEHGPSAAQALRAMPLPERLCESLSRFKGPVMLTLSGNDWIALEFQEIVANSARWRELLDDPRIAQYEIAGADHSFSRQEWRDELIANNIQWITSWQA